MPSKARDQLGVALSDVDAQIKHAASFAAGKRGAPSAANGLIRPGRPFTRAATVMLAAGFEGFVESLATETAGFLGLSAEQRKDLKDQVGRSHGSNIHHIHALFASIGMPFVLDEIGWRGLPKGEVRNLVKELSKARNQIAHGHAPPSSQLRNAQRHKNLIKRLAEELDKKASKRIQKQTGLSPPW